MAEAERIGRQSKSLLFQRSNVGRLFFFRHLTDSYSSLLRLVKCIIIQKDNPP